MGMVILQCLLMGVVFLQCLLMGVVLKGGVIVFNINKAFPLMES